MTNTDLLLATPGRVERAGAWFLDSGIQEPSGGMARFYRSDRRENARVSTEITGYGVSALLYLYRRGGDARYREAARRAGDFLCREAWDAALRLFPFEYPGEPGAVPAGYFFDCGMIVRGLLRLFETTGATEYLETAAACGESMLRDFEAPAGFHPVLLLPAKTPAPYTAAWSRRPGCFQLKAALAWLELAEATGDEGWRDHYRRAVELAVAAHTGFLPDQDGPRRTMDRLHAYSYFLEGLLAVAATETRYAEVLRAGLARLAGYWRAIAPEFERSDVAAQLLRLRLLAAALGIEPLDTAAAAGEAARAASFQIEDGGPEGRGGFRFGILEGAGMPFVNPVSTAFCLQALEMWRQHQAGEWTTQLADLI